MDRRMSLGGTRRGALKQISVAIGAMANIAAAGAAPIESGTGRFAVSPEAPPSFGPIAGSPLLDMYFAPWGSAIGWLNPGAFAPLASQVAGAPGAGLASADERPAALPQPTAAALPVAEPPLPPVSTRSASPAPDPAPTALAAALARLIVGESANPLGAGDWRGARATRPRRGGRPRPVGLGASPQSRRQDRPERTRFSGNCNRRRRRNVCRAGERIPNRTLAGIAAVRYCAERRRSRGSARRDGGRSRPRRAARRLQPATKGISRASRGIEAPQVRAGAPTRGARPELRCRRRAACRRPPSSCRQSANRSPFRPEGTSPKRSLHRLGGARTRQLAGPSACGDPRQYGDVALGATQHGGAPNRGQHSGLFGRGFRRRRGDPQRAGHRRQALNADADLLERHALRARQSVVAAARFDHQKGNPAATQPLHQPRLRS